MISQYWAGYITPDTILSKGSYFWAAEWLEKAIKAESQGKQFIVLEVPKNDLLFSQGAAEMTDPEQFEVIPFTFDMWQIVDTDLLQAFQE